MKEFFKFTLASLLGTFLAGIVLFFVVGVIIIGSIISSASEIGKSKPVTVKANSILQLSFDNMIVERGTSDDFDFDFPGGFGRSSSDGLDEILANIERASKDNNIEGIYLDLSVVPAGWASIKTIRDELIDFKKSGKWVIAYGEVLSQGAYYLATSADKIYLHPEGGMQLSGLGGNVMFFKNALDKYGLEMQVIRGRNNKFKSAVEPFLYDKMSDANREQTELYLKGIWNVALQAISESRKISVDSLNSFADNLAVQRPEQALSLGLVDGLKYKDEVLDDFKTRVHAKDYDAINFLTFRKYKKSAPDREAGERKKSQIAVIYAEGDIQDGDGGEQTIGSTTLSSAIRKARLDDDIKAIVLRVNSPGGSALASDVIWREMVLAKKAKPVVVSFGNVAASGGYYISAAGSRIFAEPNTITGSIGVFGILPNAQKLANNIGVTFDGVRTNKHSDMGTPFRGLSEEEYNIIQQGVEKIYDKFVTVVAEGRNLTKEHVDSIGQGRVWAATDAIKIGLVDELGNLEDAVNEAAKLAKLKEYRITKLPELKDPFMELLGKFTGQEMETRFVKEKLGDNYQVYQQFKYFEQISKMKGIQMRMPFILEMN
ncbi:MAG: signal peptide peptidase SppA [Bacteroidota bacterium]